MYAPGVFIRPCLSGHWKQQLMGTVILTGIYVGNQEHMPVGRMHLVCYTPTGASSCVWSVSTIYRTSTYQQTHTTTLLK